MRFNLIFINLENIVIIKWRILLATWFNSDCVISQSPLTFDTPWKEFRVEIRNKTLCALGKPDGTGLQIDFFRSWFYGPSSSISSYLEKHWNLSWWWLLLMTSRNLPQKKYVLDCTYFPFTKITYVLAFPPPLGSSSQNHTRCCPLS